MAELSDKEREIIVKFRDVIADVIQPHHDDFYLRKWLVARNWDVKKAEKMLRASLQWRARVGADSILDTYQKPEVIKKYYPGGAFGYAKDGSPVQYELPGHMDMRGLLHSQAKKEYFTMFLYNLELLQRECRVQSEKLGRRVDQVVLLYDMEDFGLEHLWKPSITYITEVVAIMEGNYPELLKSCYIFNAPTIFPIAYSIVKPFLHEATRKKVVVLGSDWQEKLKKDISEEQLIMHYGGLATDSNGDPKCREFICFGGKIPNEYYQSDKDMMDVEGLLTATVSLGSSLQVECVVKKPGSAIKWQFKTDGQDIGFGVFRKTDESRRQKAAEMEVIVPSERVNSHMVPEDGLFTCEKAGTYVVRFDNTYSWTSSKKLYYLVEVMQSEMPDEESASTLQ